MNKRFTFVFLAMFLLSVGNVFAQEDVTSYLSNPGFDEDVTWGADGSTKDIISTDYELSSRSYAYVAADSSVYLYGRGTRSDGYSPAWNGFFGQIQGWSVGEKDYMGQLYYPYGTDSPEWVYFGSVPYDLGSTAIPIADDGSTFLVVPEKPTADNGDDNKAFIYMRAGWGRAATYKQVVNLPSAQYRLEYWTINMNPSATKGENLTRVTWQDGEFKDESSIIDTEWTLHTIEFTPTSEFTIEFGFKSEGGSGSNPFLCIDGVKLYRIGEIIDQSIYIETDLTSQFSALTENTSWITGSGGTAGVTGTWACPAVEVNGLGTKQVCEFYEANCNRTGDQLYATVIQVSQVKN